MSQTMNYVGQLAGQVFVQVKELYRGLNPATLSGCIDVIVVRQPDGTLQCSPFHVRFGKMGVLRSREKVVDIEINGEPVSLQMKLGDNGEAFFVKETENTLEVIPSYLATSPIVSQGAELMEAQLGRGMSRLSDPASLSVQTLGFQQTTGGGGMMTIKKRRKRRRKERESGGGRREESGEYSEDEDMFTIDMSTDEEREQDNTTSRTSTPEFYGEQGPKDSVLSSTYTQNKTYTRPDADWAHSQSALIEHTLSIPPSGGLSISCPQQTSLFPSPISPGGSSPSTPKSDSELTNQSKDNPEMLWAWGELPHAAKPSFFPPFQMQDSLMMSPVTIPVCDSTHFRTITGDGVPSDQIQTQSHTDSSPPSLTLYVPQPGDNTTGSVARPESGARSGFGAGAGGDMEVVWAACREVEGEGLVASRLLSELDEGGHRDNTVRHTDSPSKRKDKRSHHLGSDGIYLDDITELEPDVAALYFPKSDGGGSVRVGAETGVRSANQSPQSVGSSEMDSGVDSYSDQLGDIPNITISLCGGLTDNREITREQFEERAISYQQFTENPSIIDDPNLVVKIGTKYYNWTTAAPLMLAMQVYQKPLPLAAVENIMKEKMPKKGGRWWFSWRSRNSDSKSDSVSETGLGDEGEASLSMAPVNGMKEESSSSDEDHRLSNQGSESCKAEPLLTPGSVCYRKTLRLTPEQLASLQLKEGPNEVVFSVTTQYQGTCRCQGTIYLWSWDDKIIISDIDGTITRSDTLGHILPTLGKDWTHQGIARLYHRVSQNGYKFMYCSARAIGMADMTRGYLHWVNERGTMLPIGPVLLSPSSLFSALHREVIEKKPERFKIQCLTDIKQLFYANTEPFYAAFGNRATDVYSYKEVGVPLNRIFTVNPKGELIQEHAKTNISSYGGLCEVVDHVFPLLIRGHVSDFSCPDTFSQFTYWREQLPQVHSPNQPQVHSPDQLQVHSPDQPQVHSPDQPQVHSPDQPQVHSPDQPQVHSPDQPQVHSPDQPQVHSPDQPQVHSPDQPQVHSTDQPQVHSPDQPQVHSPDQPQVHSPNQPQVHSPDQPQVHSPDQPQVHSPKSTAPTSPKSTAPTSPKSTAPTSPKSTSPTSPKSTAPTSPWTTVEKTPHHIRPPQE
ncbi:phosphatidate phosphatase LPIN1 isoform X2 [Coregonus clupeaformis]|uniref:phosphatidate phosphatase LPIN1 isoform X2 n=1 Tax=Coregonus clupeaformis TaxID=59861 RepID=UPI001BDFCA4F|nr:phosphatidate phosphatase LPIN1 isoform X2 [Coregonus clupeaformis]